MTIETMSGGSRYRYQINKKDARLIDRKLNEHRTVFKPWRLFNTAAEARQALLQLAQGGQESEEPNE